MTEPQGPIYMCYDAWLQEAPLNHAVALPPASAMKVPTPMAADADALARAAQMLAKAKHPVIIAEFVGRQEAGFAALVELAETLAIPVYDVNSRLNFPGCHPLNLSMTKDVFMSMKLEQAVIEAPGYDLVVMGQPEGAGCYCAANTLLTGFLERLTDNYPYMVIDNEAGMEHISRLTTKNVDILLIVSDTSRRGLQAAIRINSLAKDLKIGVGESHIIINRCREYPSGDILDMIKEAGLNLAGTIPEDSTLYEYDKNGRPTIEMPFDNIVVKAAFDIFDRIVK